MTFDLSASSTLKCKFSPPLPPPQTHTQGKGRGNAFLNDLCQASVLVHVVDASGCTDKEGRLVKNGGE